MSHQLLELLGVHGHRHPILDDGLHLSLSLALCPCNFKPLEGCHESVGMRPLCTFKSHGPASYSSCLHPQFSPILVHVVLDLHQKEPQVLHSPSWNFQGLASLRDISPGGGANAETAARGSTTGPGIGLGGASSSIHSLVWGGPGYLSEQEFPRLFDS